MRLAPLLAGLLILFGVGTAAGAVTAEVVGDRLTVRADHATLRDILQAVATAGHFSLHLESSLPDPITIQIEHRPLLESLQELLCDQNMLIRYTRHGAGARVEEVFVLAAAPPTGRKSRAGASGAVESRGPPLSEDEQLLFQRATSPDVEPAERIGAALTLAHTDQAERGDAVLVGLVRTAENPEVRQQALAALGALPTVPLEPVAAAALHDPAPSVRELALALVSRLAQSDPRAQKVLRQATLMEPDVRLQQTARALVEASQAVSP